MASIQVAKLLPRLLLQHRRRARVVALSLLQSVKSVRQPGMGGLSMAPLIKLERRQPACQWMEGTHTIRLKCPYVCIIACVRVSIILMSRQAGSETDVCFCFCCCCCSFRLRTRCMYSQVDCQVPAYVFHHLECCPTSSESVCTLPCFLHAMLGGQRAASIALALPIGR